MASSRGRGRGKLYAKERSETSRKEPKSIDELAKYLHTLNESNIDIHGDEFARMVLRFANNDTKVFEVVNMIFDSTTESRDYANLGSDVCELIIRGRAEDEDSVSEFRSQFRSKLLQRFQCEVKQMKQIRSRSVEHWLGIFAFLCEIYHKLKISGKPFNVVGKAILQNIYLMLDDNVIDDEIYCICNKLKQIGKILEELDVFSLLKITNILRNQVISRESSCQRRCVIMEFLEIQQTGWKDSSGSIQRFYTDAIADAIVQDELDSSKNK